MFVLALLAFRNSLNEKKKMSETDNYYTCGTASLPQVKTRSMYLESGVHTHLTAFGKCHG